jgi:5'-methylthioadenosine phosphorylase
MAHVTDYDVWHVSEEPVTVDKVIEILNRNTQMAQESCRNLISDINQERTCQCQNALASALITDPAVIPSDTRRKLSLLVDKYLAPPLS